VTRPTDAYGRILNVWKGNYASEIHDLARSTEKLCFSVFHESTAPLREGAQEVTNFIAMHPKVHADVYRILGNAARLGAYLKNRPRRKGDQSAGQYELQTRRIEWMRGLLVGIDFSEISDARVRHSLEHFDEFLDETALKSARGKLGSSTMFPKDVVASSENAFGDKGIFNLEGATVYPLRVYYAIPRTFLNCGRRIDVGRIANECKDIAERLENEVPDLLPVLPGSGSLIMLSASAYSDDTSQGTNAYTKAP